MSYDTNSIAEKLRYYRTNCSLSQRQVADALKIDRTAYTYYELGRSLPNVTTIVKLADIFGIEPSKLLPQETSAFNTKVSDTTSDKNQTPIYSLSREEKSLITKFRVLTPQQKADVLAYVTNKSR